MSSDYSSFYYHKPKSNLFAIQPYFSSVNDFPWGMWGGEEG